MLRVTHESMSEPFQHVVENCSWQPGLTRFSSRIPAVDRILGGGFVPGSLIWLRGDVGVGKSTLAMELADRAACSLQSLYASGSETGLQLDRRCQRLGGKSQNLYVTHEPRLDQAISIARTLGVKLLVVDDPQSGVLKEVKAFARDCGAVVILVGTRPKFEMGSATLVDLDHRCDVVLEISALTGYSRLVGNEKKLRTIKNRFGSLGDAGFVICEDGCKGWTMGTSVSDGDLGGDLGGLPGEYVHEMWRRNAQALERGEMLPFALTAKQIDAAKSFEGSFSSHSDVLRSLIRESAERDRLQVRVDCEFEPWE